MTPLCYEGNSIGRLLLNLCYRGNITQAVGPVAPSLEFHMAQLLFCYMAGLGHLNRSHFDLRDESDDMLDNYDIRFQYIVISYYAFHEHYMNHGIGFKTGIAFANGGNVSHACQKL
jgi:hypothetical protein